MARRSILAEMGYDFSILTADIDEKSIRKEKPEDLVMALAEAKDGKYSEDHEDKFPFYPKLYASLDSFLVVFSP